MAPVEEKKSAPSFQWDSGQRDETSKEKMIRKAKQNPFVPLGKISFDLMVYMTYTCNFSHVCCDCASLIA